MTMGIFRKKQIQIAGDNSVQQQIETQNNYYFQSNEDLDDVKFPDNPKGEQVIEGLIENMGGNHLYNVPGHEMLDIALRELIQNAKDAVNARKNCEESFSCGEITISVWKEGEDQCIEIIDNGLGMSYNCIHNYLLSYGGSYWNSSLSKKENKGLVSRGFKSVGKFGIGFYSIFMVAKEVEVITKRYFNDSKDAIKIVFPEGLTMSPIRAKCDMEDSENSTIVRIKLKNDKRIRLDQSEKEREKMQRYGITGPEPKEIFRKRIQTIIIGLDVNVYLKFLDNNKELIHVDISSGNFDKGKWLKDLCNRELPQNFDCIANRLEFIKDNNGRIRGLIALPSKDEEAWAFPSVATIGGLTCYNMDKNYERIGYIGFLDYEGQQASRNHVILDEELEHALQNWVLKAYVGELDDIIDSRELALNYRKMFLYLGMMSSPMRSAIFNANKKKVYSIYKAKTRDLEIGTVNGLALICKILYQGLQNQIELKTWSGRTERAYKGVYYKGLPYKFIYQYLPIVDVMPWNELDEIIYKIIVLLMLEPYKCNFYEEEYMCLWANLMLDQKTGWMINWEKVDFGDLFVLIQKELDNKDGIMDFFKELLLNGKSSVDFQPVIDYLKTFLVKSYI